MAVPLDLMFARLCFKENIFRKKNTTFPEKIWGYLRIACDPTVPKIGDFVVESFREFKAMYKKALTQVSVA